MKDKKQCEIQYAENGYVMTAGQFLFVFTDEIELLQYLKDFLELDEEDTINIERK